MWGVKLLFRGVLSSEEVRSGFLELGYWGVSAYGSRGRKKTWGVDPGKAEGTGRLPCVPLNPFR